MQHAKQNRPAQKPEAVTISASPELAKDTPLEQQRGQAKQQFAQAAGGKDHADQQRPKVDSEQVNNTKPEPQLKPSPELAGGVDATVHLNAKSKDNQKSREASQQAKTKSDQPSPKLQAHYEKIAARLNQEVSQGQALTQSVGQSQGR